LNLFDTPGRRIAAATAAEICRDVRAQAARTLGLLDDELLHGVCARSPESLRPKP